MSTATLIRSIRVEQLNITQKELAARVGVDAITVSRWERGLEPSELNRVRLARALGVHPNDLRTAA